MSVDIYASPREVRVPNLSDYMVDGKFDMKKMDEVEEHYFAELERWLRDTGWDASLTGKIWRYPVADGCAQYMVAQRKKGSPSLVLIHMPIGDAWNVPVEVARGIRQQDIKKYVTAPSAFGEKR